MMDAVEERVRRGIELLDTKAPGWREKIDLKTLDVEGSCACVLGQVYGGYPGGPRGTMGR